MGFRIYWLYPLQKGKTLQKEYPFDSNFHLMI